MRKFTTRDYHENYVKISELFEICCKQMFVEFNKNIKSSDITNKEFVLENLSVKFNLHTNITHEYKIEIDNLKELKTYPKLYKNDLESKNNYNDSDSENDDNYENFVEYLKNKKYDYIKHLDL